MFNKVILVGNLTRDIEMRYSQGGLAIGSTGIAVTRKFSAQNGEKREETCFVDITFFARMAEIANQYLRKGSKILIEGRLKLDQWQDQNGQNRSKHSIVVENMQMLGSNPNANSQWQNSNQEQFSNKEFEAPQKNSYQSNSNFSSNYQNNSNKYQNSYQNKKDNFEYENSEVSNSVKDIDIDDELDDDIPF